MRKHLITSASAVLFPLCLMASQTVAQQAAETPHETVTVHAPYVVRHAPYTPKRGITRDHLELISVDRAVSFSDLNLKDSKDQDMLKQRVEDAAKKACAELDRRFPKNVYIPVPADQDCVADASGQAMMSVKKLISAAEAG